MRFKEFLMEKAPPDADIEKWLEDPETKKAFKEKYGDSWESVLYATAWKTYHQKKKKEKEKN